MGKRRDLTPLPLSDADLDRLADITDDDILAAADAWRQSVSPQWRTLLDADPQLDEEPPAADA